MNCLLCARKLKKAEEAKKVCANADACSGRVFRSAPGPRYVGKFDPAAAYESAPKLGDVA